MQPVRSSNLSAIGFEPVDIDGGPEGESFGDLTVKFTNGRTYRYIEVPETVYNALLAETEKPDGSVGRVFASQVRSAGFEYEEVEQ